MTVKTFTIDRSAWSRGTQDSMLLDQRGHRCCLGFYLGACGLSDEELFQESAPTDVHEILPAEARWLIVRASSDGSTSPFESVAGGQLISVNDQRDEPVHGREAEIASIFAARGIAVTFVDGPTDEKGGSQ